MLVTRAFLYITFRVPSKGAPPPGTPHRVRIERDAPFPEPSFNYLSEFPVNGLLPPPIIHISLKVPVK
jgi:hypothetical protein